MVFKPENLVDWKTQSAKMNASRIDGQKFMNDKYFACKKLTEELFLNLPEGAVFSITDSSKVVLSLGKVGPMEHRKGDWDAWHAECVGENCHCFKDSDEFQKWEQAQLEEERRIDEEKRRKSIVPLDFA